MIPVRFTVVGVPQPQGSAKLMPIRHKFPVVLHNYADLMRSAVVTHDNERVKPWRAVVERAARLALGGVELEITGAVALDVAFFFGVPSSYKKSFNGPHIVRPDLDKCVRAVLDALTGIVYHDDAQVVRITTSKTYTRDEPRVEVTVTSIAESTLPLFSERSAYAVRAARVTGTDRRPATAGDF